LINTLLINKLISLINLIILHVFVLIIYLVKLLVMKFDAFRYLLCMICSKIKLNDYVKLQSLRIHV